MSLNSDGPRQKQAGLGRGTGLFYSESLVMGQIDLKPIMLR